MRLQGLPQNNFKFRLGAEEPGSVAVTVPMHVASRKIHVLSAFQVIRFHRLGRIHAGDGLRHAEIANEPVGPHQVKCIRIQVVGDDTGPPILGLRLKSLWKE